MTATTLMTASLEGCCSSSEPLFPLVAGEQQAQFSFPLIQNAMSFDWSDFPVINQYNQEHVPVTKPIIPAHNNMETSSSSPSFCGEKPTFSWVLDADDTVDTESESSFSLSSEEETDSAVETSLSSSSDNKTKHKKSVSFSNVLEIRSHKVTLGEHPYCSSLALELSWEHEEPEVVDFDLYESSRRFQRRHLGELRLSYWDRRNLLEESTGLCESELLLQEQRAWRELRWPSEVNENNSSCGENTNEYRAPASLPRHGSSEEITSIFRKVSSTKTLSALV